MNVYDLMMHRTIKEGKQFDKLFPATDGTITNLGDGSTELSMQRIKEWAIQFQFQSQQVAKLLKRNRLEDTCNAIHDFLYWHFQYKADDELQQLRSPSNSWKNRRSGIDCKSYSILASSLLLNLGIQHYIRKIKQGGMSPQDYTHVYVVVPKDQDTGNLNAGHFTIDGTLRETDEPDYTEKKDLDMEHAGLNGINFGDIKNLVGGNISSVISSLGCIGGTSFDKAKLTANMDAITNFFNENLTAINQAISSKNYFLLATEVNEFFGSSKMFVVGYENKKKEKNWNSCSNSNFDAAIKISKFYRDTVGATLSAYLDKYFAKGSQTGSMAFKHPSTATESIGLWLHNVNLTEPVYVWSVKTGVYSIPAFEITKYVADSLGNNSQINLGTFLSSLTQVISSFGGGSNSGTGTGTGSGIGSGQEIIIDKKPQTAGMTGVVGWLLVAGTLGYAFTQMDSKPLKPAIAKAPAKRKTNTKK